MPTIRNPVLPGFHPDPCIIRAGGWYYVATSTFEWWPGVRLHRSRDLASWELAGHALTRESQLSLVGNPDSGGVWAPGLSFDGTTYWLVYSNVRNHFGRYKDVVNYLVTADRAEGPWSDPVTLNCSGFDPSLFHAPDGRKWLLNQLWNGSGEGDLFGGIVLQEYSVAESGLVGAPEVIFKGTQCGLTEGPHLYSKDGYYYLITAEGGTQWNHRVTVARSKRIRGPYELSPHNPLVTSADNLSLRLKKAGHGSLVCSSNGEWFLAHLCARHNKRRRCILGRETALQRLVWPAGGWPVLAHGGHEPADEFSIRGRAPRPYCPYFLDDFEGGQLRAEWSTLRERPDPSWMRLDERPGFLRLRGRQSIQSTFAQSVVGFRLLHHRCSVVAKLDFPARALDHAAGLAIYYNTANFFYLLVTGDEFGRRLKLIASDNRAVVDVWTERLVPSDGDLVLSAVLKNEELQFFYTTSDGRRKEAGPALDATRLSDDYPQECGQGLGFTGTFAVLCCQDSGCSGVAADFDWFCYFGGDTAPEHAHAARSVPVGLNRALRQERAVWSRARPARRKRLRRPPGGSLRK